MNRDLLKRTLDAVEQAESHGLWDQGIWLDYGYADALPDTIPANDIRRMGRFTVLPEKRTCQTSGCFAGWVAILSGARPCLQNDDSGEFLVTPDHTVVSVKEFAAQQLDITESTADWLFDATNSLTTLRERVAALLQPEVEMGDIGEPIRHIELEPLEAPSPVPLSPVPESQPEKVPA